MGHDFSEHNPLDVFDIIEYREQITRGVRKIKPKRPSRAKGGKRKR